ncbi:putative HTH-type transcriptional regulator [Planomonospora venezuelensis]|nr:putative HTH-type transcriptional regulator [Planomonospora venezuelensis]
MAHIAEAAGCSRATLYRYFDNRHALRMAYVHREAGRVARDVGERVRGLADPRERLTAALPAVLHAVRGNPVLAAWFTHADGALTAELARSSPVIEAMGAAFLGDPADPGTRARGRWLVRVIVSLLTTPGEDDADERAMIESFVVPVLAGEDAPRPR